MFRLFADDGSPAQEPALSSKLSSAAHARCLPSHQRHLGSRLTRAYSREQGATSKQREQVLVTRVQSCPQHTVGVRLPRGTAKKLVESETAFSMLYPRAHGLGEEVCVRTREPARDYDLDLVIRAALQANPRKMREMYSKEFKEVEASAAAGEGAAAVTEDAVVEAILKTFKQRHTRLQGGGGASGGQQRAMMSGGCALLRGGAAGNDEILRICRRYKVHKHPELLRIVNEFLAAQMFALVMFLMHNGYIRDRSIFVNDQKGLRAAAYKYPVLIKLRDFYQGIPTNDALCNGLIHIATMPPHEFLKYAKLVSNQRHRDMESIFSRQTEHFASATEPSLQAQEADLTSALGDIQLGIKAAGELSALPNGQYLMNVPQIVYDKAAKELRKIKVNVMVLRPDEQHPVNVVFSHESQIVLAMSPLDHLLYVENSFLMPSIANDVQMAYKLVRCDETRRIERLANAITGQGNHGDCACALALALSRYALEGNADRDATVASMHSLLKRFKSLRDCASECEGRTPLTHAERAAIIGSFGRNAAVLDRFVEGDFRGQIPEPVDEADGAADDASNASYSSFGTLRSLRSASTQELPTPPETPGKPRRLARSRSYAQLQPVKKPGASGASGALGASGDSEEESLASLES